MHRNCVNRVDKFCYICGELTSESQKRTITSMLSKATLFTLDESLGFRLRAGHKNVLQYLCNKSSPMDE